MSRQMELEIRGALMRDVPAILACLRAAFVPYREQYTPAGYLDTVLTSETIGARLASMSVRVAVSPARAVVGTIASEVWHSAAGHLRGLAVLPEWQGRGVAARLLHAVEQELCAKGCPRVTLDTTAPLVRAISFYQRRGFTASGRVQDFFGMPLYEYAKVLRPSAAPPDPDQGR
jgi:GNAT superfamily N-acetyltransferase